MYFYFIINLNWNSRKKIVFCFFFLFQDTNKNRAYMSTKESLTFASFHVARSVPSQYCEFMKPIHATKYNTNLKLTKSSMYNTVCDFKIGKP